MKKDAYRKYLKTAWFSAVRDATTARAGGFCQVCGSAESVECHHRHYHLQIERPGIDTILLCGSCHEITHGHAKLLRIDLIESIVQPMRLSAEQIEKLFFDAVINDLHQRPYS